MKVRYESTVWMYTKYLLTHGKNANVPHEYMQGTNLLYKNTILKYNTKYYFINMLQKNPIRSSKLPFQESNPAKQMPISVIQGVGQVVHQDGRHHAVLSRLVLHVVEFVRDGVLDLFNGRADTRRVHGRLRLRLKVQG